MMVLWLCTEIGVGEGMKWQAAAGQAATLSEYPFGVVVN